MKLNLKEYQRFVCPEMVKKESRGQAKKSRALRADGRFGDCPFFVTRA